MLRCQLVTLLKLPADSGRHHKIPYTSAFKYLLPCRLLDMVGGGGVFLNGCQDCDTENELEQFFFPVFWCCLWYLCCLHPCFIAGKYNKAWSCRYDQNRSKYLGTPEWLFAVWFPGSALELESALLTRAGINGKKTCGGDKRQKGFWSWIWLADVYK